MNRVYAVGVGPGSPNFVPNIIKDVISKCDVVIGYGYTLKTIESFLNGQQKIEVTMKNQEEAYQKIAAEGNHTILVPFTGDVNFSESEVVDRLIEVFDEVSFNNILEIGVEEKQWGSILKTKVVDGEKTKEYQYSIVRDWVQYPLKDPTSFLKVNWNPIVEFVKSRQIIKE